MDDRVIIIGGGIAGLSAGVYAQRCGFRSTILESHARPGGVCTSWRRGPYLMDAGLRMIIGTSPPNPFYDMLCEVGVMHSVEFSRLDTLHCIEDESGERLHLVRNIEALSEQLHRAAPRDTRRVNHLIGILEDFSMFCPRLESEPVLSDPRHVLRSARALGPVAPHFLRYWKVPLWKWLASFESRRLRNAFSRLYPHGDFPLLAMLSSMGWFVGGQVGRPVRGARSIADAIASTYEGLGGELMCGQRVSKILTRAGRAVAVRLADGTEMPSSLIISAADGRSTIFDMLDGRYADETVRGYYDSLPVFRPIVIVHLGAAWDPGHEPETLSFPLPRPIRHPSGALRHLNVHFMRGGDHVAPAGHSVVRVSLETEYEPWAGLARDPDRYRTEKERIADAVIDRLEERYPGFAGSVRTRDVATPVTLERYTSNWRGAYEGWQPSTRTFGLRMRRTLPGLSGFYMAGQWVEPGGGVPGVLYSARRAVDAICRDLGRKFTPWGPSRRSP